MTVTEDDEPTGAFEELIRVLESAVRQGMESIELEWKSQDLMSFPCIGNTAYEPTTIAKKLQLDVIAEIVKRAQLARKHTGHMRIQLLGEEYRVAVHESDRFGESGYTLTFTKRGKKNAK